LNTSTPTLAVYYEHPDWFRPLFAELDRRGTPYVRLDAAAHAYDVADAAPDHALLFNRMSASAYLRGHGNAVFYTRYFLEHLEAAGVRVVNGSASFAIETSKALQLALLRRLGLPHPRTRVVNSAAQIEEAARGLDFPVMVKPNIGGRGAGVVRFDSPPSLARFTRRRARALCSRRTRQACPCSTKTTRKEFATAPCGAGSVITAG